MLYRVCILLCCFGVSLFAKSDPLPAQDWDLLKTYARGDYLFIGSLVWSEAAADRPVEVSGVRLSDGRSPRRVQELPIVPQRYVLLVEELFKGQLEGNLQVLTPVEADGFWILDDRDGDALRMYNRRVFREGLEARLGEQALFVIHQRPADGVYVLLEAWPLKSVHAGLSALRRYARGEYDSLTQAIEVMLLEEAERLDAEAEQIEAWRREYYTIMMEAVLAERRKAMLAFIQRLGFDRLWTYEEFVQRNPSLEMNNRTRPSDPYELLWYDASQEVLRLNMILKLKSGGSGEAR